VTRPVFGRDRIPEPWPPIELPAECKPGDHLMDDILMRCTVCGWLADVERCATVGCIFPATYRAEVEDKTGQIVGTALACHRHAMLTGIGLIPDGRTA
jgi:hypothetical protein